MTTSPPPWDSWSLDEQFFGSLSRWTIQNQGSSLTKVLDCIISGIDSTSDLRAFIPDAPFPARSLVEALLSLLKLGITISKAKQAVYDFSRDVVRWVDQQTMAFRDGEASRFTKKTWDNLEPMRILIDEICKWAYNRLEDGRWKRLTHGLSVSKEIDEFKARINEARAQFLQLSIINISQGQDTIVRDIQASVRTILDRQAEQHDNLAASLRRDFTAKKLADEQYLEANFKDIKSILTKKEIIGLIDMLPRVHKAKYNPERRCYGTTRQEIVHAVVDWVSNSDAKIYWLYGQAGTGKTAIATSISCAFIEKTWLGGTFFFNWREPDLRQSGLVFTTVAHHMATAYDSYAAKVYHALDKDKDIGHYSPLEQFQKLILGPLQQSAADFKHPVVILLDAVDECGAVDEHGTVADLRDGESERRQLLEIIRSGAQDLPTFVKFVIVSRDEPDLRAAFLTTAHLVTLCDLTKHDPGFVDRDISTFIENQLSEVDPSYDLPPDWPGKLKHDELVQRAKGLFQWAKVACDIIKDEDSEGPDEQLEFVLGIGAASVIPSSYWRVLDDLYMRMLKRATAAISSRPRIHQLQDILGGVVVAQKSLSIESLEFLIGLSSQAPKGQLIRLRLRKLHSAIDVPATREGVLTIIHPSFADFLTDQSRCVDSDLYIDRVRYNGKMAKQCLLRLQCVQTDACKVTDALKIDSDVTAILNFTNKDDMTSIPDDLHYASQFWAAHLSLASHNDDELYNLFMDFTSHHFLHWIQTVAPDSHTDALKSYLSAVRWAQRGRTDDPGTFTQATIMVTRSVVASSKRTDHHYLVSLVSVLLGLARQLPDLAKLGTVSREHIHEIEHLVTKVATFTEKYLALSAVKKFILSSQYKKALDDLAQQAQELLIKGQALMINSAEDVT